jgi:lysophospholipase L1-like esterase
MATPPPVARSQRVWQAAAKYALMPLLLWQGRQVRLRAQQLPEAQGAREGVAGVGRVCLRLLIVGDSAAAGVGAPTQSQALAGRLSEALSQRLGGAVVWQLVARRGDTTADSLAAVSALALHPADVMVTALGVADVFTQVRPRRWLSHLDQLDRRVARRCGVHHIVHSGLPPMYSFPLPNPLRWVLGFEGRRYNAALARWVQRWPDRWWLPMPFENELSSDSVLMADDGFHPGPAVYALWAEQIAGMIANEIVPRLPETTPTRAVPAQTLFRQRAER